MPGSSDEHGVVESSFGTLNFPRPTGVSGIARILVVRTAEIMSPHFAPTAAAGNGANFPYPPLISLSNLASILLKIFL